MKTFEDFLREEFKLSGTSVTMAMDYLDTIDEIKSAAVKYSHQNTSAILTDIGRVIYNPDKTPQQRINEVKDLLAFKYRRNDT